MWRIIDRKLLVLRGSFIELFIFKDKDRIFSFIDKKE